ncbi:Protein of uncharacterised function (DUF2813) [Leclercia adecarboxylata]|uniref:Protein of uncharacterized function (DUF2813) n=1 Tax=Leclercia adecarboxylata TaxID=83655 RepID=A0A4U9HTX1_9ENTR|nr:Protein of uncharacterised function (DUF2813) [Leclercia adecarboxylata]
MTAISASFYRLEGELANDDSVLTLRGFLDTDGNPLKLADIDELARHLVRLMPVLRLRDARFMRRIRNGTVPNMPDVEVTARELDYLARELVARPQNLTDGQIRQGLVCDGAAAGALLYRAGHLAGPQPADAAAIP